MTERLVVFTVLISVLTSVFVFFGIPTLEQYTKNTEYNHQATQEAILAAFDAEYETLHNLVRALANDSSVRNNIVQADVLDITTQIFSIAKDSNVDSLTVTNQRGIVLARTNGSGVVGDYLFDTTEYGKLLSEGKEVQMVGYERDGSKLGIIAGIPIFDTNRTLLGSIVASREIDQSFLKDTLGSLLTEDQYLLVYDSKEGVLHSSFTNDKHGVVANALLGVVRNINISSGWIDEVQIASKRYGLYTISLDNLRYQQQTGGLLIFVPQSEDILLYGAGSLLIILTLVFVVLYLSFGWLKQIAIKEAVAIAVLVLLAAVIALLITAKLTEKTKFVRVLDDSVYPIYNSTMHLEPTSGLFDKNFDQRVNIVIVGGGEPINAAKADLRYDPEKVRVEDIEIIDSFCEPGFVIERVIDNDIGSVTVSCGSRVPFQGGGTPLATLIIQPLVEGDIELVLEDSSAVFAHDGLGTNVLRKRSSANYQIVDSTLSDTLLLFSRTHPNSTRWYSQPNIVFSWRGPEYREYRYLIAEEQLSLLPESASLTSKQEIVIEPPRDGTFYFHLQPVGKEEIYYFKVNSDQTVPSAPNVRLSNTQVTPEELIRMEFEASDVTSGIEQPYYYVSFNNGTFFPVESPFYTSLPEVGRHDVTIRAFDNAGNYSDSTTIVEVDNVVKNAASAILSQF